MTAPARGTWRATDIPDQTGRRILVTGASSGLGAATCAALARAGADVVMLVRNVAKAEGVRAQLGIDAEIRELDLASLGSVRAFIDAWGDEPIDVLVNNAGIMAVPKGVTEDGFELQFGTNHLGHFALTLGVLPLVRDRVVTLSSGFAAMGKMRLDDLNVQRRRYSAWAAYNQSKLANLLFTLELQRHLDERSSDVRAVAAHPGFVTTELQSTGSKLQDLVMRPLGAISQDVDHGALPTLYAATYPDVPGGSYLGPDTLLATKVRPKFEAYPKAALDENVARMLWSQSEQLTGAKLA